MSGEAPDARVEHLCRSTDACAQCGVRRDEHEDQPGVSAFPTLDIVSHTFEGASQGYPEHYADYGCDPRSRPAVEGGA